MILGNRSSGWNGGLVYGYPSFAFNLMFSAAGYLALSLCRVGTDKVNFTHYSAPVMVPMTWDSFMHSRVSAGVSKTRHVDSLNRPTETVPSSTNHQVETDFAASTPSVPLASTKEDNHNNSLRAAETVSAKGDTSLLSSAKMSSNVLTYLSTKLNAVVPAMNSMNEEELREYEQLAVMAGGGVLDESSEAVLQERYGLGLGSDLSDPMVDDVERDEELGVGEVREVEGGGELDLVNAQG
eukprot:gene10889-biopygen2196